MPERRTTTSGLGGGEIGDFRVDALLEEAPEGEVYRATDMDGGEVALELLPYEASEDDESWERVDAALKAAAPLDHPRIVQPLAWGRCEAGPAAGRAYVAWEPFEGRSLDVVAAERGELKPAEVVGMLRNVLSGLAVAHGCGVVHGDLRPKRLLLDPEGKVSILGIGVGGALADSETLVSGPVSERVIYASPEQTREGPVDRRADLYAVGVLAFELLTGKPPFSARSALALVRMHRQETPPSLASVRASVPAAFEPIVAKALAKSPQARYASAAEFFQALDGLGGRPPKRADLTTETHLSGSGPIGAGFFDSLIGTVIDGEFEVLDKLGEGGMGAVYRARSELLGTDVALKVIHPDLASQPQARERFLREARVALQFTHPNAIATRSCRQTPDGLLYMTLDLSQGRNLRRILDEEHTLSVPRALGIVRQALLALAEAHPKGIVHRDLKPANLLIERSPDGGDVVKVCDFGLAKLLDPSGRPKHQPLTGGQVVMGTPLYISPEHAGGRAVDARTDFYALGSVLYELITGETLFDGEPEEILYKQLSVHPEPPRGHDPSISPEVERLIWRALEKNPTDRFQTAEEFIAAIDRLGILLGARAFSPGEKREASKRDASMAVDLPEPGSDESSAPVETVGADPVLIVLALVGGALVIFALGFLLTRM